MPWIVFQVIVILFGLARLVGSLVLVVFLSAVILAWVWIVINIVIIIIIIIKNPKSSKLVNMISTTKKDSLQTFVEIILALICGYMLVCIMALR